jgi:hypothetical protein
MASTTHAAMRQFGRLNYALVANGRRGDALYEYRDWRSGDREYRIVNPDGSDRNGTDWAANGRKKAKPPTGFGRWAWVKEG